MVHNFVMVVNSENAFLASSSMPSVQSRAESRPAVERHAVADEIQKLLEFGAGFGISKHFVFFGLSFFRVEDAEFETGDSLFFFEFQKSVFDTRGTDLFQF